MYRISIVTFKKQTKALHRWSLYKSLTKGEYSGVAPSPPLPRFGSNYKRRSCHDDFGGSHSIFKTKHFPSQVSWWKRFAMAKVASWSAPNWRWGLFQSKYLAVIIFRDHIWDLWFTYDWGLHFFWEVSISSTKAPQMSNSFTNLPSYQKISSFKWKQQER